VVEGAGRRRERRRKNLTAALEQFEAVAADLRGEGDTSDDGGEPSGVEELLPDSEDRI